ncbi:MAG: hypothetical protein Q7S40_23930 [Opitutaceae bacterium]|nr:hypothetical protein [Opitutaceae bacterium]
MKLSHLLSQRPELLRQVRLANLAYAYQTLCDFAGRIARAQIRGRVSLKPIDAAAERYCASLTALQGNQSVLDEHFSDEDILLLADVVGFATGHPGFEHTFAIEELSEFIVSLRAELFRSGVRFDLGGAPLTERSHHR